VLLALIALLVAQPQLPIPVVGSPLLSLSVQEKSHVAGTFTLGVVALRFDSRNVPGAAASLTIARVAGPAQLPIFHLETDQKSSLTVELWGGAVRVTRRPESTSQRGNVADLERLLRAPELMALVPLSFALAGAGVTGRQYPGALPLYMTALRVARFYDTHAAYRPMKALATPEMSCTTAEGRHGVKELCCDGQGCPRACGSCRPFPEQPSAACQSLLTCQSSDCLGMCGAGCSCWMFVCQDCCCNKGCLNHDVASGKCDPGNPASLWYCLRYVSGDAGAPVFECGGCSGCQR
jgi:hypothetical protein